MRPAKVALCALLSLALLPVVTASAAGVMTTSGTGTLHGSIVVTPLLGSEYVTPPNVVLFHLEGAAWVPMDESTLGPVSIEYADEGTHEGTYTITSIPAGTYRAMFGSADVCGRFYSSAVATNPADPSVQDILVGDGSDQDLGAANLLRAGHLVVHVQNPYGSGALAFIRVYRISDSPDWADSALIATQDTENSYQPVGNLVGGLTWLPTTSTGAYRVLVTPLDSALKSQWVNGGSAYQTAGSVLVEDGKDTTFTVTLKYRLPFASLGTPSTPSKVTRSSTFTVSGTIKPRHTSGSKAIKLYFYHSESGHWVLRKTVTAKVSNYKSYSKYSVKVPLSSKGKWRVRSYHSDSKHAPTYSAWRNLTVT